MKKFILVLIFFLEINVCFSQSPWTSISVYPNTTYVNRIVFSIENKVYMVCGQGNQELWEFDTDIPRTPPWQPWQRKADFPGEARKDVMSFSINNKGYMGLGTNEIGGYNNSLDDFYEYDPYTDTWTERSSPPSGISKGFSFVINGKGYIGGGHIFIAPPPQNYPTNYLYEFNPTTNLWTWKADLVSGNVPVYTENGGFVSFSADGFGFVGLGATYNYYGQVTGYKKDLYKYSPVSDSWSKIADFPGEARASAIGFSSNNKGYVGNGRASGSFFLDFWEYSSGNWKRLANIPGSANNYSSGTFTGSYGYIGPGVGGIPWYSYNPACDFFSTNMSGPELICTSGTFTLHNVPQGAQTSWNTSNPNALSINTSGFATRQNNFNGQVTVTATLDGGCGPVNVNRNVWVGTPNYNSYVLTVDNDELSNCDYTGAEVDTPYPGPAMWITAYEWRIPYSSDWNIEEEYGGIADYEYVEIEYYDQNPPLQEAIQIRGYNACGWSYWKEFWVNVDDCAGYSAFTFSPNPANDELTISNHDSGDSEIVIHNSFMKEVYHLVSSDDIIKIPVSNFPEGTYYLQVANKEGIIREQILIKR